MSCQIDGLNWLCDNWWIRQPCILADEMGLVSSVLTLLLFNSLCLLGQNSTGSHLSWNGDRQV